MDSALIGLLGVLIGLLIGEYFRRKNRVEIYSHKIFERRLEVYEEFMQLIQEAYSIANEVMGNPMLTAEQRHQLISQAISPIAAYADSHTLYIDGYVGAHATAMFMGAEDIQAICDTAKREAEIKEFRSLYVTAKEMILEESGIKEINKHFKLVSGSNPKSPIINRIKELEHKHKL